MPRPSAARFYASVGALYFLLFATAYAVRIAGAIWAWAAAFVVIGTVQYVIAQAAHEAIHFYMRPATGRRARTLAYFLFYAIIFTPAFSESHFAHHRFFGDPALDPDYAEYKRPVSSKAAFFFYIAEGFTGIRAVKRFLALYFKPSPVEAPKPASSSSEDDKAEPAQRSYGHLIRLAFTQLVIAVLLWQITGRIWAYPILWVAPMGFFVKTLNDLRLLAEHGFFDSAGRPVLRGFLKRDVLSYVIAPYGFTEHVEHHLFAAIPYTGLPDLRKDLMANPDKLERAKARAERYSIEYVESSHVGYLVSQFWSLPTTETRVLAS